MHLPPTSSDHKVTKRLYESKLFNTVLLQCTPPVSQPTGVCKSVRYISLCGALHSVLAAQVRSALGVCKSVRGVHHMYPVGKVCM